MGMFDSFYPTKPLSCPNCGKEDALPEFQTKSFARVLARWKQGEVFDTPKDYPQIIEGSCPVYEICRDCKTFVEAVAHIVAGRFSHITITTADAPEADNEG